MDICKFKGTMYYKAITNALLSGNIHIMLEDFTDKDIAIEEYFSGDMAFNGELLSKDDKSSLLNSIQRDLEKENMLSDELKQKIESIRSALDLSRDSVVESRVVKVPSIDVDKLKLFKIPLSKSKRLLDISTKDRGKLIPILNQQLNGWVASAILSSLKEVCLWNEDKRLIIADNRELTESILTYRNSLIQILSNFIGDNVQIPIAHNLTISEIEAYNNLMQSSWDAIKTILSRFNGEINVAYDKNTANSIVNPIMAFYVLLNFDEVLSAFLSDFITINPGEFGNLNASQEKYKKKASKRLNSSYDDSVNNSDGENLLDSILDTFITSTQLKNGMYLEKKFKENLLCVIIDAVENKNVRGGITGDEKALIDSLKMLLSNDGTNADLRVRILIKVLSETNSITHRLGSDECSCLAERLEKFLLAIDEKKRIATSKQFSSIDSLYNVGYRLVNHIANKGLIGLTAITGTTETNTTTPGTKEKSKQYVRNGITSALVNTLGSNHWLLTDPKPLIIGRTSSEGIIDLYSERVKDMLSKITGLNFRDDDVIEMFSDEKNLQKLANFLSDYRRIVREMYNPSAALSDKVKLANEMMELISGSSSYIAFSDIFVAENEFEILRMFDQQKQEQARTTIATLSTKFSQCYSDFLKYMGTYGENNVLVRFPKCTKQTEASFEDGMVRKTSDFAQYITFLGDCKFKNGDIVRWVKQRPNEINTAYINLLYLFNVLDHDTLSFLIDVTSDKMKTPLANINLISGEINFVRESLDSLKRIKQDLLRGYYNRIRAEINDFFFKIFGDDVSGMSLLLLDDYIYKKDYNKIIERIREIQNNENGDSDYSFTSLPEVFYSTIEEKDENGHKIKKLRLNRCLCYEMLKCENASLQQEYDDMVFDSYKKTLIELGVMLNISGSYIDGLDADQKRNLASMFFDDVALKNDDQIKELCELIKKIIEEDNSFNNTKLTDFLRKFITLQNIVRESAILVFNKHYWVHGKAAGNVSISELGDTNSSEHKEVLKYLLSKEMKKRIEKSTKRNNSQSATFSPMDQGFKHGVPPTIRVASIESLNKMVWNNFGNSGMLHAHDGAIYSAHICRIWERNSQTLMHMANSAKIIALLPSGAGFYQIKCADYSMNNEWIRNSISKADSNSDLFVDGKQLYKLMLSPADATTMLKNIAYDDEALFNLGLGFGRGDFNVFYNFQGNLARLTNIQVENDKFGNITLVPSWELSNGELVDNEIVALTLGILHDSYSDGMYITDLYDLWQFFGAELSQSLKEDGTIDFSDASLEYVAYLVSEYAPELKSLMISKICDPESVKSTPFPINSRDDVYNKGKALVSVNLQTKYYGPQLDYSHETDEDTIPFTTLVIGAIAFNGQNSEMVQDLYETIGLITAEALAEFTNLSLLSNKTKLYKKIGKLVANNLSSNGIISNAASILNEALRTLVDDDSVFAKHALPLSDNQLYHAATAQILSKLNRMIKQRFAGTAVVQNPSLGIVGVYEGSNGIRYNKSVIIQKALKWYKDNGFSGAYRTQDIVNLYLNRDDEDNVFKPKVVFGKYNDQEKGEIIFDLSYLLNIADNVLITALYNEEEFKKREKFLRRVKDEYGNIIEGRYDVEIQDPFVLYLLVEDAHNGLIFGMSKVYNRPRNLATTQVTFQDAEGGGWHNLWLLLSTLAVIRENAKGITESKWWHHENLKGIGDKENPYYYATLEDFRNKVKTYINKESVTYRGGEEALPKQYKRKFGINGAMSDVLEMGIDYFRNLANTRMKADSNIKLDEFGDKSFVISTNDYDIIFANPSIQVGENVTLEQDGNSYRLYTANDELIPNIKLPSDHNYSIQYVAEEKPKIVIVTNNDISSDDLFILRILKNVHANSVRFNGDVKEYAKELQYLDESNIDLAKIEALAQQLLTSFKLTLKTVSVRIPSQSFQSFLPNETVLFTESDDNNGYMNIWEMWFQGSDFDIDKAYTIMFEPSENGVIEGNIFSDYSSPEKLLQSFLIRQPNEKLHVWGVSEVPVGTTAKDIKLIIVDYLKENYTDNYIGLNNLLDTLKANAFVDGSEFTLLYTDYDGLLLDNLGNSITIERFNAFVTKLNAYNHSKLNDTYKKNKAMAGIRYASLDIHNLKASQVPMESADVNQSIEESLKRNGSEDNMIYLNDDPGHIAHFLYQNAIGKEGVGISANSIKVLSAVLQNTNNKIKNLPLNRILEIALGHDHNGIDLEFKLNKYGAIRTLKEKVLKIPNTPMTFEQFEEFYKYKAESLPIYEFFEKLEKKSFELLGRIHLGDLTNKEKDFLKCYQMLSSLTLRPIFLLALYLMEQFEQNTADMMSIFISLCTDNAKELSLFKIGATPDLLNLPLAMLTLGMDIQDVTDICVLYIVPLMDELNVNRYAADAIPNVESILKDHREKAPDELKSTYESLLKIYDVALEMKLIARQFKVNQGVSVITTDVQNFLNSLNKQMADSKHVKYSENVRTYADFFGPNGKLNILTAIDNYKATAINVVDIITGSANFFKLLEACYRVLSIIEDNISVSHLTATVTELLLTNGIKIKPTLSKVVLQTVQNALISEALKSLPTITFEKRDTERFGKWDSSLPGNTQVGVSTKMKIDNLLSFIENAFIPYLQKNHKDNFFVLMLRRNTSTGRYELPFDIFGSRGDLRTKMDITKATLAFALLSPIVTGMHTLEGVDITFGDLMYLYSIIVNQNRANALSTITKEMSSKTSMLNIAEKIDNVYAQLDRLTSISTSQISSKWTKQELDEYLYAKNILDELSQKIMPYAEAKLKQGSVEVTTKDNVKLVYKDVDDKIFPLYTMIPGRLKIDVGATNVNQGEWKSIVKNNLQEILNGYNSSAKVDESSIAINGETLTFNVILPAQMGKLKRKAAVRVNGIKDGKIYVEDYNNASFEISKAVASLSESLANIVELGELKIGDSVDKIIQPYIDLDTLEKALKIIGYDLSLSMISTFALNLYNWMISERDSNNRPLQVLVVKGLKYIKSHIDKLATEPILIINPYDFSGKPRDVAYTLMNLFLDKNIDPEVIPTPQRRLVQLLISLTGDNNINEENLSKYLKSKDILKKINESPAAKNWYQGYLDDTTLPLLKETAWRNLEKFQKALSVVDVNGKLLYYYVCDESIDNEIGDIFVDENGAKYIYLGDTDTNLMILRNIDPESEESVRLTYKAADEMHSYKRVAKQRINSDYSNNKLKLDEKDKELYKDENTQDIHLDDLVTVNGKVYYVSAVLYEKLPNRSYNTIILGSSDGKTLEDITSDKYDNIKRKKYDIDTNEEENFTIEGLPEGNMSIKEYLVNNMSYGTLFKYYYGDDVITGRFKSYSRGYITTMDQKLIPIELLHSINKFDLIKLYPKLNIDTLGLSLKVPKKESIASIIYGRPEFRYGYIWKQAEGVSGYITPKYAFGLDSDNPQFFRPFNIGADLHYRGIVNSEHLIEKNDTILTKEEPKKGQITSVTKYVVLDKIGDLYIVLLTELTDPSKASRVNGMLNALDSLFVSHKVITVPRSTFDGGKLYKDEESKGNVRMSNNNQIVTNAYDLVTELLNYLSKRFGAPVQLVDNMLDDSVFARVNNGVIEINMSKKPEGMKDIYYILEQGVHEFMHLALTALKIYSPAVYLQLMNEAKSLPEIAKSLKYYTDTQRGEEALVHYLVDSIMQNVNPNAEQISIEGSDISKKMLQAIQDLLLIDSLTSEDLKKSLRDQLSLSKIFRENTFISQEEMLAKTLRDEYMERINYVCD